KGPCPPVRGSRALISQAIANMLDNALKYAVGGKTITVRVGKSQKGAALLTVADDGPGVPEKDRGHVLKRFVRLETSRTTPGSGLGLSLVTAIARAHGATLRLADASDVEGKRGLKLTFAFPQADKG
ncbi:MAG: sensor histidine kinase, partial [Amphiplicatus sp.]